MFLLCMAYTQKYSELERRDHAIWSYGVITTRLYTKLRVSTKRACASIIHHAELSISLFCWTYSILAIYTITIVCGLVWKMRYFHYLHNFHFVDVSFSDFVFCVFKASPLVTRQFLSLLQSTVGTACPNKVQSLLIKDHILIHYIVYLAHGQLYYKQNHFANDKFESTSLLSTYIIFLS